MNSRSRLSHHRCNHIHQGIHRMEIEPPLRSRLLHKCRNRKLVTKHKHTVTHTVSHHTGKQGRINHCAGCIPWEEAPPPGGPRSTAKIFSTLFWRLLFSVSINVTTTTKIGRQHFLGKSAPPEKILATRMRKMAPALLWYGAPEWLFRPCRKIPCSNDKIRLIALSVYSFYIVDSQINESA